MHGSAYSRLRTRTATPNMQRHFGECVSFIRGSEVTGGVRARRADYESDDFLSEADARIESKMIDWVIKACDLRVDGAGVEPKRGDQVMDSTGAKFEVFPGLDGEHWEWFDSHRTEYRIHTVLR